MRYCRTPVRMAISYYPQIHNHRFWTGCGEKGTHIHCSWECKLVQPLWKTVRRFPQKLRIELPYDPAVSLLGIYLKNLKTFNKDICTLMLISTSLFMAAKIWEPPKCPLLDCKMWYIHTTEHHQPQEQMKYCHLRQHGGY